MDVMRKCAQLKLFSCSTTTWCLLFMIITITTPTMRSDAQQTTSPRYTPSSVIQCTDASMSRESLCLYAPSCDQQWLTLPDPTVVEQNGTTKTVVCPGLLELDLLYLFDPVDRTCMYTLDTGSQYAGLVRIQIAAVSASAVWNHTTTDLVRTDPHVTVSGDAPLCAFLKSVAVFQCAAPFLAVADNPLQPNTTSEFCTEASVVTFECGSQLIQCGLDATLTTYTCSSLVSSTVEPSFIQPFAMRCSAVSPFVVGAMLSTSGGCNALGRLCVTNIQNRDLARQVQGPLGLPSSFENDVFTCNVPFFGPFNVSELCELLPTHQQVSITCFAQQLVCFSPFSRTSDHTCRYQGGELNLYCGIPQSDAGPLLNLSYAQQAQLLMHQRRRLLSAEEDNFAQNDEMEEEQQQEADTRELFAWQRVLIPGHGWVNRTRVGRHHDALWTDHQFAKHMATTDSRRRRKITSLVLLESAGRAINTFSLVPRMNWPSADNTAATVVVVATTGVVTTTTTTHGRRLLSSLTPQEIADQLAQNERVCDYLLATCGTSLNCTTDSLPPADAASKQSRGTFCTSPLPTSCYGFNQLPAVPITSTPQFIVADQLTVSIQCRQTATTFHNIVCSLVPQYTASECWYFCSAREAFVLTLSAFPVPANVLLSSNYTASQRCFEIKGVAESAPVPITVGSDVTPTTLTIPNFFDCAPPFVTTVQDICIHAPQQDVYTLACGVLTMVCRVVPNTFLYQCNSSGTSVGPLMAPYLVTLPTVPLAFVIQPPTPLTLLQQCLVLRDTYAQNYSCPGLAPDLTLVDSPTVFCNIVLNATQMIAQPPGFICGAPAAPVVINCTLQPSNNLTYTCVSSNASAAFLTMQCPGIDPYRLLVTLNVGQLSENVALEQDPAFRLQRCLAVKQLCSVQPSASFSCNPQYRQDSSLGQFCDVRPPDPPFNRTLTCGVDPVHSVFCTNQANLTAINDWLRCNGSDAYLAVDCQVERRLFDAQALLAVNATHPDEWMCDLLRVVCPIPVTCNPLTPPGYCPAPGAPAVFDCAFPAQACDGYFCQLSSADANDVPRDLDGTQNVGVCRFEPDQINVTCAGFVISCQRQSVFAANTTNVADIQYNCTRSYSQGGGFNSTGRDMQLGCMVPRIDLDVGSQPFHTCLRIGLRCLAADGGIECSQNYITSLDAPFCSLPANPADVGGAFLCNGLVVLCVPSATTNRVQCSSLPNSLIWVLGANRNSVDFPTPPSTSGCVLSPRDFYLNPAQRCSTLFTTCLHSCSTGFSTAPGANASDPNFCQEFSGNTLNFACDGQAISCVPVPLPVESDFGPSLSPSDLNPYMIDADLDRHRQQMQCTSPSSSPSSSLSSSLTLSCIVNRFLFLQRPDACSTLLSQCLTNMGTLECIAPYISTPAAPFCTTTLVPVGTDAQCNCGLWWSRGNLEGLQQIPYPLRDISCYASQLQAPADLAACRVRQAATAVGNGLTCARRGYVSMEDYLMYVNGPALFASAAQELFAQHPEQLYWCLYSLQTPALACAVQPGMRLQPCTVECPADLQRTTIRGSTAEYCCRDPARCTLEADGRNCVLGRHDANVTANFLGLVPTQTCPTNLFNSYSTFPVVATVAANSEAGQWAQARQLCSTAPGRCFGFTVLFNLRLGTRALYFFNRPPAFVDETVQQRLDPTRVVQVDREARYPLHTVPQSQWPRSATRLYNDPDTWSHQVTTFILERARGYDCADERLQWLDYALNDPAAQFRIADRVNEFLVGLGASQTLIQNLYLPSIRSAILTSTLHNAQQLVNGSFVFVNAPFLVLTPRIEAIRDLLHMLAVDNVIPLIQQLLLLQEQNQTLTAANLTRPFAGSSALLDQLIDQEFVRLHHPAYDAVVGKLPLFGTLRGDFRRVVRLHEFLPQSGIASFVTVETGTAVAAADLVEVGWLDLPSRVAQIRFATFADLYAWFAQHDWHLYGSQVAGGQGQPQRRPQPSTRCRLQTLPWADGQCSVPQDGCPLPVDPTWDWGADELQQQQQQQQQQREGSGGVAPLIPNPAEADVQHDTSAIPCGNGKGFCVPSGTTPAFRCVCQAPFAVQTGMLFAQLVNGVRIIPRSLQAYCEIDMRDKCMNVARGVTTVCSNRGQCVVAFSQNRQTAVCQCGNFPIDPAPGLPPDRTCNELVPRTCEIHQLPWIAGGFEEATVGQNLCRVPRVGCRDTLVWSRSGGNVFQRGDSRGCEVPAGNPLTMPATGRCVPSAATQALSPLDPFYQADVALDAWSCQCVPGRYGATCQYVALDGGCYSTAVEALLAQFGAATETSETWCIWNAHLIQWEVEDESNIPDEDRFGSIPRSLCRGLVCSGHGTCTHTGMNNAGGLETYTDPNDAAFQYGEPGLVSAAEQAFVDAALQRVLAQNCTCSPGWTGQFCEQRTCVGGCGSQGGVCQVPVAAASDPRVQPFCLCPTRRRDRQVLVQGSNCQGPVCGGHGQLVVLNNGTDFDCQCTPPFYQGPRAADLCSLECPEPGTLITASAGRAFSLCVCYNGWGVEVLCSDLVAMEPNAQLILNISNVLKLYNETVSIVNFSAPMQSSSSSSSSSTGASSSSGGDALLSSSSSSTADSTGSPIPQMDTGGRPGPTVAMLGVLGTAIALLVLLVLAVIGHTFYRMCRGLYARAFEE